MSLIYKPPESATLVDVEEYQALLEEGYPAWKARVMMGWADPPDHGSDDNGGERLG